MIDQSSVPALVGATVLDPAGERIGKVGHVYLDDATGQPEWITVRTGFFGTKETFIPLAKADFRDGQLVVSVTKQATKDAPRIEPDGHLEPSQEAELYEYYGLQPPTGFGAPGREGRQRRTVPGSRGEDAAAAAGVSGTAARKEQISEEKTSRIPGQSEEESARAAEQRAATIPTGREPEGGKDEAMTRSEERLRVRTEPTATHTVRLHKYVDVATEEVTVRVRREDVRLEREPITDANRDKALAGPEISEAEFVMTLHEEHPIVEKEVVPIERVRLAKETKTENQTVSGQVRKERIELEDDARKGTQQGRETRM